MDFLFSYPGVYIASPQYVTRADVSDWRGDMIIHDEAHQGSTAKSKLQRKLGGYHPVTATPWHTALPTGSHSVGHPCASNSLISGA